MKKIFYDRLLSCLRSASQPMFPRRIYYFSLDKQVVNVYWNSDGTMSLDYH